MRNVKWSIRDDGNSTWAKQVTDVTAGNCVTCGKGISSDDHHIVLLAGGVACSIGCAVERKHQVHKDIKNAGGEFGKLGPGSRGHGFSSRYDSVNKVHDTHLKNLDSKPGINHSFGRRTCVKCKTVKPIKGGRMRGGKFVCSACSTVKRG